MILTTLLVIILFSLALGASWLITCGIIKLITMCFGLTFSWPVATGIWLILILVSEFLGKTKS